MANKLFLGLDQRGLYEQVYTNRSGCLHEEIISIVETLPLNGRKHGVTCLLVGGFQQVTPHSAPLEARNHPVMSVLLCLSSKSLFHKAFTLK